MPGPNVLDLVGDIREAVARLPHDQLVDILTYVFKEYVVEGPAPLAAGPTAFQDDLQGMSFAEVMRSLQLRLDLPELELFDVQSDRVTVRLQGRAIPIEVGAGRAEPGPPPPAPSVAAAVGGQASPSAADRSIAAASARSSVAVGGGAPSGIGHAGGAAAPASNAGQPSTAAAQQSGGAAPSPSGAAAPAAAQQLPAAPRSTGLLEID